MRYLLLVALIPTLAGIGCGASPTSTPRSAASGPGDLRQSNLERDLSPAVANSELATLTGDNAAFALDLYQVLRPSGGNIVFSPHSISMALAMTYAGARASTEAEMAEALRFTLGQDRLHVANDALDLDLDARNSNTVNLSVVNQLFGQHDQSFVPAYLDLLAVDYGAGLRLMDFENEPEGARTEINDWVASETHERINDLLPPGSVTVDTKLVLANAVYMKAQWATKFEASDTVVAPFSTVDGGTRTVSMMQQHDSMAYAEGDTFQAVELPYDGDELAFLVLLPRGPLTGFEDGLDADFIDEVVAALDEEDVELHLPKLELTTASISFKNALEALGMHDAFSIDDADFSGMAKTPPLHISDVFHKAFIKLDESGTEAAAGTAVGMVGGCAGCTESSDAIVVDVNKPFIFVLRDRLTGEILFVGRIVDP